MSVKYAVLGLLHEEPRHGYAVRVAFEDRFDDVWELTYSQVYQVLTALAEEGLIIGLKERVGNRPLRTVYALSPRGTEALHKWLHGSRARKRPFRDDFYVRLHFLERTGNVTLLRRVIDEQIEGSQECLASLLDRREAQSRIVVTTESSRLFTEAAILHAEATLRALVNCQSVLGAQSSRVATAERAIAHSAARVRR